jgi:C1A family cysteine protease
MDNRTDINMTLPKLHWKREPVDSRDKIYAPKAIVLPRSVDLRSFCSPIEDQGQLGSCTGNAVAGVVEYLDRKSGKNLDVSRLFIYYEERLLEGTVTQDAGAYIRDGIKVVNKKGAPLESIWPYNINKFATKPNLLAYSDAAKRKAGTYEKCANFAAVKNALARGFPVVIGFDVYESFYNITSNGIMPYPNVNREQLLGGHAVALVGYNDNTNRFIARNSWGTDWGDHGYFYMPYQVIQNSNMSSDFWTITSITNP